MTSNSQGSGQHGMSKLAKAALIGLGAAGATAAAVFGVKKVKQWQADRQAQLEPAVQEPTQERSFSPATATTTEAPTPQASVIQAEIARAPITNITGEKLDPADTKILFARWFGNQVTPKSMIVVDGGEVGPGEGDFLIGEATYKGRDQIYVWELQGKNWTKIATVANGNGQAQLSDLKLDGTPFAIEVGGRLYRSGGTTVPGTATLAVVEA